MKRIFLFSLARTLLLAGSSVAQQLICAESEDLYEIEGEVSDDAVSYSDDAVVSIYVSSDHASYRNYLDQESNLFTSLFSKTANSWQGCLPSEQCYMAEIDHRRADPSRISIRQNGEVVHNQRFTFPYMASHIERTYVELGDCIPECKDHESLFELDFYIGDMARVDWKVHKLGNNDAIIGCDQLYDKCVLNTISGDNRLHRIRHCLPRDSCYRFISVDEFYSVYKEDLVEKSAFNLTLDGNKVASREGFRFESIEFGEGCDTDGADVQHCDKTSESLFELFLARDGYGWDDPPLSFKATDLGRAQETLLEINDWMQEPGLAYYHTCLPQSSCVNLTISVPETYNQTDSINGRVIDYAEYGEIRAALDGVSFHDGTFFLGEFRGEYEFANSFVLGSSCKTGDVCNQQSESLFDITLSVPSDEPKHYQDFSWSVVYYDHDVYRDRGGLKIHGSRHFSGYIAGSTYQTFACIPNDFCTEFSTYDYGAPCCTPRNIDYSILVNGEKREDSYIEEQGGGGGGAPYINTILGGKNCPSTLSKGGVAGIIVASVVVVAVLVFAIWRFWDKRSGGDPDQLSQETAPSEEGINKPTIEETVRDKDSSIERNV